jgi:hypothetical protein
MDSTLIHADIFFFISSIAVIIIGITLTAVVFYALRIAVMISAIVKKIKEESDHVVDDIAALRMKIKEESQKAAGSSFGKMISGLILGNIFKRAKHSNGDKDTSRTSSRTKKAKGVDEE